jgi:hypothetical protein
LTQALSGNSERQTLFAFDSYIGAFSETIDINSDKENALNFVNGNRRYRTKRE